MRPTHTVVSVAALMACSGGVFAQGVATAQTPDDIALNGVFQADSIGGWARLNHQYNSQPEVSAKWTIHTTCTTMEDCTGTVVSDQGWTAPITMNDGLAWYVHHDIPNWERCEDGTAFTGRQTYWFYPIDEQTGHTKFGAPLLTGKDITLGPSGACGQNKRLEIELPFRLDKLS